MNDMTEGNIGRHLLRYAIPLIFGNILQLTYNAVDSIIIGKYLGEDALAAVSASNPIMTVMILGASGIGIGASVLISRFYGAKDYVRLKREFSTTVIFGTIFSLVIFLAGFMLSGNILRLINTPEEVLEMADIYLKIIFVGFLFTFQYNILSSAMRAIGDSKTPVRFLGLSCCLNIGLDFLFVTVLKAGAAGAGLATSVSEGVSIICCIAYIYRHMPELRLSKCEWIVDKELLTETVKTGTLTALQQAAQPIGKVIIQSVINAQGIVAIGAFNAVCRIDDFACIPAQSMGSGIMTCTAQNRGAHKDERVRESFKKGMTIAVLYFPIICSIILILKLPAMKILAPDESQEMILMGTEYLSIKAWFFIMPCMTNAIQGFFRGMGRMKIVLFSTVLQISVRTLLVSIWVPRIGIVGEAYACMAGWLLMLLFEITYYFVYLRRLIK